MSIIPEEPPKPQKDAPQPPYLENVFRQVQAIQEQLKKQREAKKP